MHSAHTRTGGLKRLEARRLRELGHTGAEIAAQLNVSEPTVWRWLRDFRPSPSPATRARELISRALIELGKVEA